MKSKRDDGGFAYEDLIAEPLDVGRAHRLRARAVHVVEVGVGASGFRACFSDRDVARAFADRYRDQGPRGAPIADFYAVEDRDGVRFWCDRAPERARRYDDRLGADFAAFFADAGAQYEFLRASPYLGLHAAVLANERGAIAIVGATTAGKTTTAIACARRGLSFYSDERCIVRDGRVVPFLRRLTLRAGGRELLLADAIDDRVAACVRALGNAPETPVHASTLFGDAIGGPERNVRALFVIADRAGAPVVERVGLYGVLPSLLRATASGEGGIDRIARLDREFRDAAVFAVRLGTPDATARAILAALD